MYDYIRHYMYNDVYKSQYSTIYIYIPCTSVSLYIETNVSTVATDHHFIQKALKNVKTSSETVHASSSPGNVWMWGPSSERA